MPTDSSQSESAMGCSRCDQPTFHPGLCSACQEAAELCEHAGHEWADAGGGVEMCTVCLDERDVP